MDENKVNYLVSSLEKMANSDIDIEKMNVGLSPELLFVLNSFATASSSHINKDLHPSNIANILHNSYKIAIMLHLTDMKYNFEQKI